MKKICYVTTIPLTLDMFVKEAAEYLYDNNNYEITFISSPDREFQSKLPEHINFVPVDMKRGIDFNAIQSILKMYKIFKQEKFDYIQFSTPNASLYASIASFFSKSPIRVYAQWGIVYVQYKGIKRFIYKSFEKIVCTLASHVQPDSYGNLKFSESENLYLPSKGNVVWNGSACGVDLEKFSISHKNQWNNEIREKYNITKDDFILGFVGRIKKEKGIEELLTSFFGLSSSYKNLKLIIVGEVEMNSTINEKILKKAMTHNNIIFTGKSNEVEKIMASFNLFVLPSYREGFGTVVIEAASMGVASIVSKIPGPTEAIVEGITGESFEKENHIVLTETIEKYIKNAEKCETMGLEARKYVENNFNRNIFFEKLDKNIKQLIYPPSIKSIEKGKTDIIEMGRNIK